MKLKDIAKYCLYYTSYGDPCKGNFGQKQRYYWSIGGRAYAIMELQTYGDYSDDTSFTNLIHLCRYKHWDSKEKDDDIYRKICLNLDHDVTIFNDFILVNATVPPTDDEHKLFHRTDYDSIDGYNQYQPYYSQYYVLNLVHPTTGLFMKNLRILLKDLIDAPVQPKPAELTLDQKLDDLVEEYDRRVKQLMKIGEQEKILKQKQEQFEYEEYLRLKKKFDKTTNWKNDWSSP